MTRAEMLAEYLALWTAAPPATRASRKAKRAVPDPLPNNVVSLAEWRKVKLGNAQGSSVRFEKAKVEAALAAMQTGSK